MDTTPSTQRSRRPPVIWLTCTDGRDHASTHMIGTTGAYATACGTTALPAASQDPPQPRCPSCLRYTATWRHERTIAQRLGSPRNHTRIGWLRRAFCRARR